jgi:hypothetical protein
MLSEHVPLHETSEYFAPDRSFLDDFIANFNDTVSPPNRCGRSRAMQLPENPKDLCHQTQKFPVGC